MSGAYIFHILLIFLGISFLISMLLFLRFTIRRLDRKVKKEGSGTPSWDKGGMGLRVGVYSVVLVRGKKGSSPIPDEDIILRYARPIDRVLAFTVDLSLLGMFILWLAGKWLGYF